MFYIILYRIFSMSYFSNFCSLYWFKFFTIIYYNTFNFFF